MGDESLIRVGLGLSDRAGSMGLGVGIPRSRLPATENRKEKKKTRSPVRKAPYKMRKLPSSSHRTNKLF